MDDVPKFTVLNTGIPIICHCCEKTGVLYHSLPEWRISGWARPPLALLDLTGQEMGEVWAVNSVTEDAV